MTAMAPVMRAPAAVAALIVVSAFAVASGEAPHATDDETAAPLVIIGGTLVDGTGGQPFSGSVIVIQDGQIQTVATVAAGSIPIDGRRIEAHGTWIIPGLIDMHVHDYEWMDTLFLRHGVTTVRDVGNDLDRILELRRLSRSHDAKGPRVFTCGPLIDGPLPRHGTELSVSVSTEAEARAVARQLVGRGVDCLKVYEQLTPALVLAIADEAQRAGIPVAAHLRDTPAVVALEAGVKSLEHASGFAACDERAAADVARVLLARNAYIVPTLAVLDPIGPRLPCLKRFVGRLRQLDGRVVAGSDTANSRPRPGALLHRELELLVEAGLSPKDALMAATSTAAGLLAQRASRGTIQPGKTADLVILRGDPLKSIAETQSVDVVIREGRVVWKR